MNACCQYESNALESVDDFQWPLPTDHISEHQKTSASMGFCRVFRESHFSIWSQDGLHSALNRKLQIFITNIYVVYRALSCKNEGNADRLSSSG
jgi:hypothetical protein